MIIFIIVLSMLPLDNNIYEYLPDGIYSYIEYWSMTNINTFKDNTYDGIEDVNLSLALYGNVIESLPSNILSNATEIILAYSEEVAKVAFDDEIYLVENEESTTGLYKMLISDKGYSCAYYYRKNMIVIIMLINDGSIILGNMLSNSTIEEYSNNIYITNDNKYLSYYPEENIICVSDRVKALDKYNEFIYKDRNVDDVYSKWTNNLASYKNLLKYRMWNSPVFYEAAIKINDKVGAPQPIMNIINESISSSSKNIAIIAYEDTLVRVDKEEYQTEERAREVAKHKKGNIKVDKNQVIKTTNLMARNEQGLKK